MAHGHRRCYCRMNGAAAGNFARRQWTLLANPAAEIQRSHTTTVQCWTLVVSTRRGKCHDHSPAGMMWIWCGMLGEAGSGYMLSGMRQIVASKMVAGSVGSICSIATLQG